MIKLNIHKNIADFLCKWIENGDFFEFRSFYGETFTLALLERVGLLNNSIKEKLLKSYEFINKNDSQFHWEFNNYALLDYYKISGNQEVLKYLNNLVFKNTPVTNWTLLRSVSRLIAKKDEVLAIQEAKLKIRKFQLESGLILDKKDDKSFQYHCFSISMIGEIYIHTNDEYFKNSFLKGVDFIRNFILINGETLYIGRGQKQSFGYGALIYILTLAYKFTNDKTILGDIERVLTFLLNFKRENGSFPLVMNKIEKKIPKVIDMQNEEFLGWYPYNNYFDYLPFMGFFIAKAQDLLKSLDTSKIEYVARENYIDCNFIKIVKTNYEAVLSKPGGYWTNDITIPYIVTNFKNITPCYGGEQFQKSLYSSKGLPLPYCKSLKQSIRWKSISFFKNNSLLLISPLGIMKRDYIFGDDYIEIETRIYSIFSFIHIYLFFNDSTFQIGKNLKFAGFEFSVSGKLRKYIDNNKISKIRIDIES